MVAAQMDGHGERTLQLRFVSGFQAAFAVQKRVVRSQQWPSVQW
jgi:hypothetical protein